LTLLVARKEGHPACKTSVPPIAKFCSVTSGERKTTDDRLTRVQLEKRPLKQKDTYAFPKIRMNIIRQSLNTCIGEMKFKRNKWQITYVLQYL